MGKVFNMVGGGSSSTTYAFIVVSYPVGSTCTCTKDSKTLRAKDTSGACVFYIPEAGTWTVSITDGSRTKSQPVSITTQGQSVSVTLAYKVFLYNNGDNIANFVTYGKGFDNGYTAQTPTFGASYITLGASSSGQSCAVTTYDKIDLSDYTSFNLKFNAITTPHGRFQARDVSGVNYGTGGYVTNVSTEGYPTGVSTITGDISSLSGSFWILFGVHLSTVRIMEIWLE